MKILFVHKQILFPRDTGGKIRVLNLLKHLARWHDITYVSNLRPGEEQYLPPMQALGLRMETVVGQTSKRGGLRFKFDALGNLFSSAPFTISRNYDPLVRQKVTHLLETERFDLLICDTIVMARCTMGLPVACSILFQHNVEAQILRRHSEIAPGRLKRMYMRRQWHRMERFEKTCGLEFDGVIAVSQPDKLQFERDYGWRNVFSIDTAVDEEFFSPQPSAESPGRVLFLGSMDWMPNQDGVKWFVREVWPQILTSAPQATFHIVGRNPPPEINALKSIPGVVVVGGVPDVRPHLAAASVVVVPLLVGGGTRLKIYEAMTMARATVSTTIGAEGLPVVSGEHFLAADDPSTFASAVTRLLADPELRIRIGQTADRFVREHFGSESVARQFEKICLEVLERKRGGNPPPAS